MGRLQSRCQFILILISISLSSSVSFLPKSLSSLAPHFRIKQRSSHRVGLDGHFRSTDKGNLSTSKRSSTTVSATAATTTVTTPATSFKSSTSIMEDAQKYTFFTSSAVDIKDVYLTEKDPKCTYPQDDYLCLARSARDIDSNSRRTFLYQLSIPSSSSRYSNNNDGTTDCTTITEESNSKFMRMTPPIEIPSDVLARIPSPSGEKVAILRSSPTSTTTTSKSDSSSQTMEIWTDYGQTLQKRINLPTASTLHGPISTDPAWFGSIAWDPTEKILVYPAECPKPKTISFFSSDAAAAAAAATSTTISTSTTTSTSIVGGSNTLGLGKGEDWGEKYTDTCRLNLYCLHVETTRVGMIRNTPNDGTMSSSSSNGTTDGGYTLGQPIFSPCGSHVIYTAWDAGGGGEMPRRLGSIYCFQRACKIYSSSVKNLLSQLESNDEDVSTTDKNTKNNDTKQPVTSMDNDCYCITSNEQLARSPRFFQTRGGQGTNTKHSLAFLGSSEGFSTHGGCSELFTIEWEQNVGVKIDTKQKIVGAVQLPTIAICDDEDMYDDDRCEDSGADTIKEIIGNMSFPGLFVDQLPSPYCASSDGKYLYMNTQWGSVRKIIKVSTDNGNVSPVNFGISCANTSPDSEEARQDQLQEDGASQNLLYLTKNGDAVVSQSQPNTPPIIGYIPSHILEETVMTDNHGDKTKQSTLKVPCPYIAKLSPIAAAAATTTSPLLGSKESGFSYHILNTFPSHGDVKALVQGILLLPTGRKGHSDDIGSSSIDEEKFPLIVVPHGGPHAVSTTAYIPSYAYLCQSGYAILHTNYRGSAGFGQAAIKSLPGNAGSLDVKDVVHLTKTTLERYSDQLNPDRVGVCGGSHGGFLSGHLIGQFPDIYKVAAMRNPVTNIATMVTPTDIPDWCYVETFGNEYYDWKRYRVPTRDELGAMYDASPIAHIEKIKQCPTLVAVGMKDRRVPPSQSLEYFYALRSKGVKTKLLVYDDDDHAIDKVASEADHWVNIKRWFDEHL